ncbi:MAG: dimethyl sulfone monooxygenase SfnG [Hyphomicrobium sp.]|uniref:dimethylsulfone monooxygenase SfnG n=1 Tax=Hyphomicrobium sp. TaxID=82 RepID=UPI0039E4DA8C
MKFAYWSTNLGGVLFSSTPQNADPDLQTQIEVARRAELAGFDYTLVAARFLSTTGAAPDLYDALASSTAIAVSTNLLNVIAAIHPGLWHPAMIAKFSACVSAATKGRFHVNIISGWFKDEFIRLGEPWLDHDERYRRSEEFVAILRGLLSGEKFSFSGDFYRVRDLTFRPSPPRPVEIFQGGNSLAARALAARQTDWYFMNGDDIEGVSRQIAEIRKLAEPLGRSPRFAVNAFVILRDTEKEAAKVLEDIIAAVNSDAVEAFRVHAQGAGSSTKDRIGMWANSNFANLVQPNDGFKTGLIGTEDQIRERVRALEAAGVDLILCGFLDFLEEPTRFGAAVITSNPSRASVRNEAPAAIST